jgi:DNA-binding NarL/FixJ family response regulator
VCFLPESLPIPYAEGEGKCTRISIHGPSTTYTKQEQNVTQALTFSLNSSKPLPNGMKRRVIIVDPHTSIREMLAETIVRRTDLDVVAGVESGLKGLETCRRLAPNLVICEIGLPELCGAEMLRRIRLMKTHTRTLIYSGVSTEWQIARGLSCKPHGFVTKSDPIEAVCEAARIVANGGAYFSSFVGNPWMCTFNRALQPETLTRP